MSKVVLISVAASVGLGLLSLHLVKQLKEGEATIADLKAQVTSLQEQQQRQPVQPPLAQTPPPEQIAEPPREVIGTPAEKPKTIGVVVGPNQVPPAAPNREERMRMMREQRERQRQLMQDPEYREAMRVQTRGTFARTYPGVIQELGLDQQQADEFLDLLADQQMRANEQMQSLWEAKDPDHNDPAAMQERQRKFAQLAAETQRNNEAELAARFGQDKLQAWREYQSTMGTRFELENMRNTLAATGLPLSEDMSKPLLKALAQANKADMSEYATTVDPAASPAQARLALSSGFDGSNMERQLEVTKKRNQRMLDAISPYLSFEQRKAIEKQQEAQLKLQEAQLRLMRAQQKSENSAVTFVESTDWLPAQPECAPARESPGSAARRSRSEIPAANGRHRSGATPHPADHADRRGLTLPACSHRAVPRQSMSVGGARAGIADSAETSRRRSP
jgi:hypothetical protein